MNGFMMCVLLAATGQVGDAAERDYGWQINPDDGKLEYIVQLSLEKANHMVSASQEQESDVPSDVAARLSRVVVRIGSAPIVSTPLEDVRKLPVVTTAVLANIEATAGRGRFSQLENAPAGEVRNIAGDKPPLALPTTPSSPLAGAALPEAPGASLADQASELGNNLTDTIKTNLSDALSSRAAEAMRVPENLLAQNLAPNNTAGGFLNESRGTGISAGTGKFSNTGAQPSAPAAGPASPAVSGTPSGMVGPMPPSGNYPTSPTHQHVPGDPYHNDGTAAAPSAASAPGTNPGYPANGGYAAGGTGNTSYPANNTSYPANNSSYPANNGSQSGANMGGVGPAYNNPAYNSPGGNYAGGTMPGYNSGTGYGMTPVNNGNLGGNFGSVPRGAQNPAPYGQYATPGNAGGMNSQLPYYPAGSSSTYGNPTSVYASDPISLPSGAYQPTRLADNRAAPILPNTTGGSNASSANSPSSHSSNGSKSNKGAATDHNDEATDTYPNGRSGMENVLPVMFVLSLVVNFYLGMLIRKLLARYRSLLSSVRGQAV